MKFLREVSPGCSDLLKQYKESSCPSMKHGAGFLLMSRHQEELIVRKSLAEHENDTETESVINEIQRNFRISRKHKVVDVGNDFSKVGELIARSKAA